MSMKDRGGWQTDPRMPSWESLPRKASLSKREEYLRSILISVTQRGQGERLIESGILTLSGKHAVGMQK